ARSIPSGRRCRGRRPATAGPSGMSNGRGSWWSSIGYGSRCAATWADLRYGNFRHIGGRDMRRLGLLLGLLAPIGLALAGCGGKEPPPLALGPIAAGVSRGIDMATDSRDVSQELKGSGLHFVARYYRDPASRLP